MRRALSFLAVLVALPAAPAAAAPSGPVVAVLDSGVDVRHPALRGHVWRNADEIAGNGIDDDANGYADDRSGADMVDRDGKPADPRGHGTHIAGIVARRTRARIMAVRVIGRDGTGSTTDLAAGIDYAVTEGARVINLSVSGYGHDPAVADALARAGVAGVLVVVAAGNTGRDLDAEPDYPASYQTPGMLVVASGDRDGRLASWSSFGAATVDIVAPGADVRSALPGRRYGLKSGTSQAAAAVTRAAVRLLTARPTATAIQVREILLGSARPAPTLAGEVASGGLLNLGGALASLGR